MLLPKHSSVDMTTLGLYGSSYADWKGRTWVFSVWSNHPIELIRCGSVPSQSAISNCSNSIQIHAVHWPIQFGIVLYPRLVSSILMRLIHCSCVMVTMVAPRFSLCRCRRSVNVTSMRCRAGAQPAASRVSQVAKIETRKCWVLQTFRMEMWSILFRKTN